MVYTINHFKSKSKFDTYIFLGDSNSNNNSKGIIVREEIYDDDTISTVLNKIHTFTNIKDEHIYLWCKTKISFGSIKMNKIIESITNSKELIPYQVLIERINNIFVDVVFEYKD